MVRIPRPSQSGANQSIVGKVDARIKIVATLALLILAFFATTWQTLGIYWLVVIALYALAKVSPLQAWRVAAPLLLVALITALCNLFFQIGGDIYVQWGILVISSQGIHAACFYGLRLAALILVACLLMITTPILSIVSATEWLCKPLAFIGVPVHDLALIAGIALRFLPELASEFSIVKQAHAARCARVDTGPLRIRLHATMLLIRPMLVNVFKRSEYLAQAMEARCYRGAAD